MLNDFYNKIIVLHEFDIEVEAMKIIRANTDYLVFLLKSQLQVGKDGNDQTVTIFGRDYYKPLTIQLKEEYAFGLGEITEWITNYFSGYFYSSLTVITEGDTFSFTSDAPYFSDIIKRSGKAVVELSKKNLETFANNILIPQIQAEFTRRWNSV